MKDVIGLRFLFLSLPRAMLEITVSAVPSGQHFGKIRTIRKESWDKITTGIIPGSSRYDMALMELKLQLCLHDHILQTNDYQKYICKIYNI